MGSRVLLRTASTVLRKSYLKDGVHTRARGMFDDTAGGPSMLYRGQYDPSLEINYVDDPRLAVGETFTRATIATTVDFEGLVRQVQSGEARFYGMRRVENLFRFTEDATNAYWTKDALTIRANVQAGPMGGAGHWPLADRLEETNINGTHRLRPTTALGVAGRTYVSYFRVKASERSICFINVSGLANGAAYFDLLAGTTLTVLSAIPAAGIYSTGDGFFVVWARWVCTSGAQFPELGLAAVDNASSYQGVVGQGLYFRQAQTQDVTGATYQGPSEYVSVDMLPAPYHGPNVDGVRYFVTNTVGVNLPRYTATAPAVGRCGLLRERASKNVVLQSENFGTTWTAFGTPTRSAAAKTCGSVALDLIGDDDAAAIEYYQQPLVFTGDGVKAFSIFFAQGTSATSALRVRDTTAAAERLLGVITWAAGVPTITMNTGTLTGIDTLGNGVFRARCVTTAITAANTNVVQVLPASDVAFAVGLTGNGYFGGVQAEDLDHATSYIPTTTVAVTRNSDSVVLALSTAWWNEAGSTVMFAGVPLTNTTAQAGYYTIDDTTANERHDLRNNAGSQLIITSDGGVTQASLGGGAWTVGTLGRSCYAFALNDFSSFFNGASASTDVAGTLPSPTTLTMGVCRGGNEGEVIVSRLHVTPRRIPDSLLAGLMAGL